MIKNSYDDILKKVSKLDILLSSLGIPINKNDRIHKAIGLINKLNNVIHSLEEKNKYLALHNQNDECLYSIVEISELVNILDNLGIQEKNILKDKLIKILNGPLLPNDETENSNHSRNTMFELSLTADLNKGGFKAKLGEPNPDIEVSFSHRNYLFQCKRTFSEAQIEKEISDAKHQLLAGLEKRANETRGVIALSVTKIYMQGRKPWEIGTENLAKSFLFNILESFIERHQRYWKKITDKKIVATLLHISCPVIIIENTLLTWAHFMIGNNIHDDNSFNGFCLDFQNLLTE